MCLLKLSLRYVTAPGSYCSHLDSNEFSMRKLSVDSVCSQLCLKLHHWSFPPMRSLWKLHHQQRINLWTAKGRFEWKLVEQAALCLWKNRAAFGQPGKNRLMERFRPNDNTMLPLKFFEDNWSFQTTRKMLKQLEIVTYGNRRSSFGPTGTNCP